MDARPKDGDITTILKGSDMAATKNTTFASDFEATLSQLEELVERVSRLVMTPEPEVKVRRNSAGRLVDDKGRFVPEGKAPKAPKAKTGTVLLGFTKGGLLATRSSALLRRLNIEVPKRISPESVSKAVKAAGFTPKVVPAAELPSGKLELAA